MDPFEQALRSSWPGERWRDVTVVAAVSGGPDSVAMLRGLAAIRQDGEGRLLVAHFNHRLRGEQSDADERFVAELAGQLDLGFHAGHADSGRFTGEEAYRQDRYRFLREVSRRTGARFLATAHTADDQAETILHRIVRGTGLAGLAGIPRTRPITEMTTIIRPMLAMRRAEILEYLARIGQDCRQDESNLEMSFTRNRIRHRLLPDLQRSYNPRATEALLRLGRLAVDAQGVIESVVDGLRQERVRSETDASVELDCAGLRDEAPLLVRELMLSIWRERGWPLQPMDYSHWTRLAELVSGPGDATSMDLPDGIRATRRGDMLRLERANDEAVE